MTRTLLDSLREYARRHALLAPGDVVLTAVSGGADSVALLLALLELRTPLAITVAVAHLDHGLRGAAGAEDRAFVEALAHRHGVQCASAALTVPPGNVEAEARRLRYAFLERAADDLGATKIATAHTRDDQAETVLLRLVRGAGRRGLGGIRPRRGRIIRPLLGCDRLLARNFLLERGGAWRRDATNFAWSLERTRMRHGFLPALAREFNPRLAHALATLADVMREEDDLLDRLAAVSARDVTLAVPVLHAIEAPLARRAVRHWWRRNGSGRRLGRAHVEAVRALAARTSDDGEIAVPGGAVVRATQRLRFRPQSATASAVGAPWEIPLPAEGEVETPGGWRLQIARTSRAEADVAGDTVCVVDADAVGPTAVVRNRRPGDRLRALGLDGHTSIKRLLASRRVPRDLRPDHPLVVWDGEILWVPGCGRSDRALVGPGTARCWVVRVLRSPNESA